MRRQANAARPRVPRRRRYTTGINNRSIAIATSPPGAANRTTCSAGTVCGAVVVTLNVTVALDPFKSTGRVAPEVDPFVKVQSVSLAAASGEQESVTVPVNPPFGETVMVVEPD